MTAKTLKEMRNDPDGEELEDGTGPDEKEKGGDKGKGLSGTVKGIFKKIFSSKKALVITVAGLILLTGLVTGGLFFFGKDSEKEEAVAGPKAGKEEAKTAAPLVEKIVFEDIVALAPFERIRLKEGSGMKLVSMTLSLELSAGRYKQEVQAVEDQIRQIVTEQAAKVSWLELRNPEGKILFKYDLLKRMNSIFSEAVIRNIYFTYFLMQ